MFVDPPWDDLDDSQREEDRSWFDVMQVCRNGHKITELLKSSPQFGKQHCPACGAATISKCEKCQTTIQGFYHVPRVLAFSEEKVPAFCGSCGTPYPWTESSLRAAQDLTQEVEGLSEVDRQTLRASLDDLVRESPRTTVAATRFKRIVAKAGKGAADAFKEILIGVISESQKR